MSVLIKFVLVVAALLVGLVFHLRNDQLVRVDFLAGSSEWYLSIWLIGFLAIGALLGVLACLPHVIRIKRENARLSRQLKIADREINNLRVIPLKDSH